MDEANVVVQQTTREKRVPVTRENVKYQDGGGGAVNSVNGKTGDVVLNAEDVGALPDTTVIPTSTSQLTNDSNFQTGQQVATAVAGEATLRETADNNLQSQIDAISASSDVTDIVGTYAELQAYDTSTLGDKDIIKVLQDEQHSDETTYYRWSTATQTFTLIGEEGPYYTKSAADERFVAQTTYATDKAALEAEIGTKQNKLTAGQNITIDENGVISASGASASVSNHTLFV